MYPTLKEVKKSFHLSDYKIIGYIDGLYKIFNNGTKRKIK